MTIWLAVQVMILFGLAPATTEYLAAQATKRGVAIDDAELWTNFAHVLVNTKEFIFLR